MKKSEKPAGSPRGRGDCVACALALLTCLLLLGFVADVGRAQEVPITVEVRLPDSAPADQPLGVRLVVRASVEVPRAYVKLALSSGVRLLSGRLAYVGTLTPGQPVELEGVLALTAGRAVVDASAFSLADDGRIAFGRTQTIYLAREEGLVRLSAQSPESARRMLLLEAIGQNLRTATTAEAREAFQDQLIQARMDGYVLREADLTCEGECRNLTPDHALLRLAQPINLNEGVAARLEENIAAELDGLAASSFRFTGKAGDRLYFTAASQDFDPYLYVFSPAGVLLGEDDDGGGGTSARFPREQILELSQDGDYTVVVRSALAGLPAQAGTSGAFTLRVARVHEPPDSAMGSLRFGGYVVAPDTVELRWDANATSGEAIIERDDGSGFAELARVEHGQARYLDSGLERNHSYTYRLRFRDRNGLPAVSLESQVFTSPAAAVEGGAERALANQAQTLGDAFRATGTFQITLDGQPRPLRLAKVEIRNGSPSGTSTLLATGLTDNNGNFDIQVTANQVPSSNASVFARAYSADNVGGRVSVGRVTDASGILYSFNSGTFTNFNATVAALGTTNATSGNVNGPFVMYDSMVEGWKISQVLLNFTPPAITVVSPIPASPPTHLIDDNQAFYVNRTIYLDSNYGTSRDMALHEYGHFIADLGGFAQMAGGSYTLCRRASPSLAWGEGWATFFAVAGQHALGRPDTRMDSTNPSNQYSYDLETGRTGGTGVQFALADLADDNPCSVSFALWDMYDSAQDSLAGAGATDLVAAGFAEVTATAASGVRLVGGQTRVSMIEMFYDAWFQRRFDIETPQTSSKVRSIFADQNMNYAIPPAAATGAAATIPLQADPACPAPLAQQLLVSWQDNSTNETGYRIERRTGTAGTFQPVQVLAADTRRWTDCGLTSGIPYSYRVQAFTLNRVRVAADLPSRFTSEATATPTAVVPNLTTISVGQTLPGSLATTSGQSTIRPGRFAARYRLSLTQTTAVRIDLSSTAFDTYLYLLNSSGSVIAQDDDSGGSLNSRITITLGAGDYTIEVTSFSSGATGSFTLSVAGATVSVTTISLGQTVNGSLATSDPASTVRSGSFADRYTFTLSSTTNVVISMGSSQFDTYLYLLSSTGTVLTQDDDSGGGTNSRISRSLGAGTYLIEATSYSSNATGNYALALAQAGGGSVTPIQVPTPSPVAGSLAGTDAISSCRSGSFADRYSFSLSARTSVRITLISTQFDAFLCLFDSGGNRIATDDDSGGGLNARISTTLNAGSYTFEATSFGSGSTGSYTLTIETAGAGVATPISLGQTVSGNLSTSDAASRLRSGSFADLYAFSLSSQTTVSISLSSSAFDAYLYLFRGDGRLLSQDDDGGGSLNSRIVLSLEPGDYVIEATSFSSATTGSYTLSLSGNVQTVTDIAVGQSIPGSLAATDATSACRSGSFSDRYRLTLSQTTAVIISISSSFDSYVCLFNQAGTLVGQDDDSGGNLNARLSALLAAGTYFIEATSFASGTTGGYTLSVAAASGGQITTISVGQTVNGSLSSNDAPSSLRQGSFADRYSLSITQSTAVVIELTACSFDSYLYLLSSSGSVITQDDDSGSAVLCSRIARTLSSGTYIIEVTSYSSGATGSYTLSVTSPASAAATPISVNQTISGSLASTDATSACRSGSFADRYSLSLTSSTPVTINMTSSAFDSYLCLFDSTGRRIAEDDDSGGFPNSRIAITLAAGNYLIEATSFGSSVTGSYTLSVQGGSTSGATISLGQTVSGNLSSSDGQAACRSGSLADRYSFTLSSSTAVTITMISNQFDTYLCLLSSTGSLLAQDDDSGGGLNSRISQTLGAGTYIIEATSYDSSATGSYSLTLASGSGGGGGGTTINFGQTLSGNLSSSDSASTCRPGSFADRYTFTVTATTTGQIDMVSSAFDSYLCLFDSNNVLLTQDDDSGGFPNARISGTLAPGTYFIEATSFSSGATGAYTVSLSGSSTSTISLGQTINGTLATTDARSNCDPNAFADPYSFILSSSMAVTITMTSTAFDTYLCLFNSSNVLIAVDDDSGGGTNSRLSTTLAAGSYVIEATSFLGGVTGSYTISLQSGIVATAPGVETLTLGEARTGKLETGDTISACMPGVADRYSFSVAKPSPIEIRMNILQANTALCLFDANGTLLERQDVNMPGEVRISRTLAAGQYTVEAASAQTMALVYKISAQLAGPPALQGVVSPGAKNLLPLTSGNVAQIADGQFSVSGTAGNFTTTIILVNPNLAATTVQLSFRDDKGDPLSLGFESGTSGSFLNVNLPPQGSTFLRTNGSLPTVTAGSAQVLSTLPINGSFVFAQSLGGRILAEAAVGIFEPSSLLFVPVDNAPVQSLGTLTTGLAVSNTSSQASDVGLIFRDEKGDEVSRTTVSLPAGGHIAANVPDLIPASKDRRGSVEVNPTPGTEVVAVGIKARNYSGTITALPVITETGTNFFVPQIADGIDAPNNAVLQTNLIFVNPSSTATAHLAINFRRSDGTPLELQFAGQGKGSSFTFEVSPRGTLFLESDGSTPALAQGSAVVTSDTAVNGQVLFVQSQRNDPARVFGEAPVPLSTSRREVMVPVDNSGGFVSGLAVANTTPGQSITVGLSMTDESGLPVGSANMQLVPNGQTANVIIDPSLIPASNGRRGTLRILAPSGSEIAAVGIRGNNNSSTLTTLPAIGTSTQQ